MSELQSASTPSAEPPNYALENGRADKQRAFRLRPWRRAAQRERWTSHL
jgi:hypothetical protein